MNQRLQLVIAAALLVASPAAAQTFDEPLVAESNSITVLDLTDSQLLFAFAMIDAAPQPDLVIDYGLLGDSSVSVTWRAPAGQRIEIAPPASDWEFQGVSLSLFYGSTGRGNDIQPIGTVTSEDFTASNGVAPSFSTLSFFAGQGGDAYRVGVGIESLSPGEVYTFSSLTVELAIPGAYNMAFNSPINEYNIGGSLLAFTTEADPVPPPNPGQWIRIVPEPGSLALLGLGGLIVCRRRRVVNWNKPLHGALSSNA